MSLISGIEKFYAEEGYVTFFCRNFLSHSAENFRKVTLLCSVSKKIQVFKKFMDKRWGYQDFPSKTFCLTVLKKFVGDPLGCY